MFGIGQSVVCIDNSDEHVDGVSHSVIEGAVYVVRWFGSHTSKGKAFDAVRLVGIVRGVWDTPLRASRFRPVKQTSIEVFRKILEDA